MTLFFLCFSVSLCRNLRVADGVPSEASSFPPVFLLRSLAILALRASFLRKSSFLRFSRSSILLVDLLFKIRGLGFGIWVMRIDY